MPHPKGITITEPRCLARHDGVYCSQKPELTCPKCLLVTYCSEECRKSHWPTHKPECVAGIHADELCDVKKDKWKDPGYYSKYAAVDVLNLEKNEGKEFDGALDLLFLGGTPPNGATTPLALLTAAESSLRNLIYTYVRIPDTAKPLIHATVNETSPHHLARLVITLLILTDATHDPIVNAEAVVHLWYSAKIPHAMYHYMEDVAGQLMDTIMDDMRNMHDNKRMDDGDSFPITLTRKKCTVVISINRSQWLNVMKFVRPSTWSHADAAFFRGIDCKKHAPPLHHLLKRMTSSRAAGMIRWRSDGILLPYGHPREDFDTLNPLFFADQEPYPVGATQEPLMEWPMDILDYPCGPAQNDVYGKMFYYVRDLCVSFQQRLREPKMEIRVTSKLLEHLHFNKKQFDRIEAGDNWDWYPLLTFVESANLLRHEDENPNATLLIMSRDTVCHNIDSVKKDLDAEDRLLWKPAGTLLDEYAPPLSETDVSGSRAAARRHFGLIMWRNWDKFSDRFLNTWHYLNDLNEDKGSRGGILDARFSGLAFKAKNTVTRRWPNRVVHSPADKPSLRDFNRWMGWGLEVRPGRWLEWKKVGDVEQRPWLLYHKLGLQEKSCVSGDMDQPALREAVQKCIKELNKPQEKPKAETEEVGLEEDKEGVIVVASAESGGKEETDLSDVTMGRDPEPSGDEPKPKKKKAKRKKKKQASE